MIVFRSDSFEIDLSNFGLTLNEESNMFMDNMIKSYTFPFSADFIDDVAKSMKLPNIDDVEEYLTNVRGVLVVVNTYYEAVFRLEEFTGDYGDATIYFGEETLPVYETEMKSLPWPVHIVNTSQQLATAYLSKGWPTVSHNFPRIHRPDIAEKTDYEHFQFFANNYTAPNFVQNQITGSIPDEVYENRNVLCPCPYLLEMLTFGFKVAGKKVRGEVLGDSRLKKLIYLPKNFIEKFQGALFSNFEFSLPDSEDMISGRRVGVYERTFTPDNVGSYAIKFNINLDPVLASYYRFRIFQKDPVTFVETDLFFQESTDNRVTINDEISVNITSENQFDPITIQMVLPYVTDSISQWNGFGYRYTEGRLNELIGTYSLSEYMPDMKFGEYVNAIKNWLNLDISIEGEYVNIDYVQSVIEAFPFNDLSKYEIRYPKRIPNNNRVFRLTYSDGSEAIIDRSGQIFSDLDKEVDDIVDIKMEVRMALVEQNYNVITAVYPEDSKLIFAFYNGLQSGKNDCVDKIDGFYGRVEDVYREFWKQWLAIRTSNTTITDTVTVHESVQIRLRSKLYKYNRLLLPKSIRRKQIDDEFWEIEMEAETI